jgi:hypothetical protein
MPQPLGTISYTSMPAAGRSSHVVAVRTQTGRGLLTNQGAPFSGFGSPCAGCAGLRLRPFAPPPPPSSLLTSP